VTSSSPRAALAALRLADAPERWSDLGFTVIQNTVSLGGVALELGVTGSGIVGWRLRGARLGTALDGLSTEIEPAGNSAPRPGAAASHPNGALGIDHVVVVTPRFERTAAELATAGLELRRIRQAPGGYRQGFRRLGPAILELVEASDQPDGPARFWGLVVNVSNLDALAERLGDRLGRVKQAVQPGRRIATLRGSAGLGEAVAFMTPEAG
jgi:hypothetical protein